MGAGGTYRFGGTAAIVAVACLPLALLLWLVLRATGGAFVYSLDDPYIHLALARSILHGTYGLNPGELSAPSSSILWPFLLAPFALLPAPMFELVPLAANAAMLAVSLWLIARQIEEQLERRLVLPVLMLLAWGAFLKQFTWLTLALVLAATVLLFLTALRDEKECIAHFGDAYRAYMRGTRRFIPFVL